MRTLSQSYVDTWRILGTLHNDTHRECKTASESVLFLSYDMVPVLF
jgi:hypothetical protein